MQIPKQVLKCHLWEQPEYQPQPVKLLGFTLYWKQPEKYKDDDSRQYLIDFGFKVLRSYPYDSRFYEVELPKDWSFTEKGYWTEYYDQSGVNRISQFDKFCSWDSVHFISILK